MSLMNSLVLSLRLQAIAQSKGKQVCNTVCVCVMCNRNPSEIDIALICERTSDITLTSGNL